MGKARKMLTNWESPAMQGLIAQIETQSKETLTQWVLDEATNYLLPLWHRTFPEDMRPDLAIQGARDWLAGKVKLTQVKPLILQCHAAAREAEGSLIAQGAARAIGQCASTIHSPRHCIGLPLYGALALARDVLGPDADWRALEEASEKICEGMLDSLKQHSVEEEPHPAQIQWHC